MNLFVTGGTGFLGSYFLQAAIAAGHNVRAIRRSIQSRPRINLEIQPKWLTIDLSSIKSIHLEGIDTVVHFAAAGVGPHKMAWETLIDVNISGSIRLMEAAADAGVKRFVAAGTCHEYGSSANRLDVLYPNSPLEPLTAYGTSKAAGFMLMQGLANEVPLEFFYGRVFTAYGEGQDSASFWPSLKKAAIAGKDFWMTSGEQISDFIHATDVADHFLTACHRQDMRPSEPLVVNIGSGKTKRLLDFAKIEWSRLGATGSILAGKIPDRDHQIYRYTPDISTLTPSHLK